MTVRLPSGVIPRFAALFGGGALLALVWFTFESIFIKRLTFEYLLKFSLPFSCLLLGLMVALMSGYVWLRLKRLEQAVAPGEQRSSDTEDRACRSLLRLPAELFWITVGYGGLFIPIYHVVHYIVEGHSLLSVDEYYRNNFIRSFLYQQAVTFSTAILYYAIARRLIRPMLLRMRNVTGERWQERSFLTLLTTTFAGLAFVNVSSILWFVMVARIKSIPIEMSALGLLGALNIAFAAAIFMLLTFEFRRELQLLARSLRSLLHDRNIPSYARIPVLSNDEVGRLAIVFNRLQARITREYDEVETELRLAREVRLQLLPPAVYRNGEYLVQVEAQPEAAGGEFYDVIPLGQDGFAVIAGNVPGAGMPAALRMSAALLLLRAEAEEGGSPSDILDRFERASIEMFPGSESSSVALLRIDVYGNRCYIASRGRANVARLDGEGSPLAMEEDLAYELRPADRIRLIAEPDVAEGEPLKVIIKRQELGRDEDGHAVDLS